VALTVDRASTPRGELVLRRDGEHLEIISNGVFLMDTRNGESERRLVRAALERHSAPRHVLIGGLGVGFSLIEALSDPRVDRVAVVEIEPAIVDWHNKYLAHLTGEALSDKRSAVVIADIRETLRNSDESFDAICLDVDNGPEWTVTDSNGAIYSDTDTALITSRLSTGGVLTVWSAAGSPSYQQVLSRHFGNVVVEEVPVARGEPDVVFTATGPVAQTQGRDSDSS
jgi:spermidine synthase